MLLKILRACFQANSTRLVRRALALRQQGDLPEATSVLREAARKFPHDAVVAVNLALVLLEQNQADAGAAELERAMALDPANAAAHYNYANLLRVSGRHEEALRHYRLATQVPAPVAQAQQELMFSLLEFCARDEAERVAERLREVCRQKSADWPRAVAPLTALYLGLDSAACKEVAAWHAAEAARDVAVLRMAPFVDGARLRIGYLSQDCRDHPVGHLLSAALPLHDRSRCKVFAYSYGANDRSTSRRDIERGVEHFVDIAALSDAAAAARIAARVTLALADPR
jgi:predicted O-linked N-acetylglucosamine transferase (SPINDLY family)